MHIADFALERYFAQWEFAVRHVLCASDVESYEMAELLALADDEARDRWNTLRLGYTESLGLPALRHEIASLYSGLSAEDVITFAGAEEGVFLCMHALLGPGDHAVVVWPAYQSLHEVARSAGSSAPPPTSPGTSTSSRRRAIAKRRPRSAWWNAREPRSP